MITLKERFTFNDPYLAAASGLAYIGGQFYVVSDDELGIVGLHDSFEEKGQYHKLFRGKLSDVPAKRKKQKPDFESLVVIQNQLLIVPSGSKPNRHISALVSLEDFSVTALSFKKVFEGLQEMLPELNIEGSMVIGETIRLFQRGNGKFRQNAIIDMNLEAFLADKIQKLEIKPIELGLLNGVALTFTDAVLDNGKILFLAVAETGESTYLDGDFKGAVLGTMKLSGEIISMTPLDIKSKPEGIAVDGSEFFIVTDDDDRAKPSKVYSAPLP